MQNSVQPQSITQDMIVTINQRYQQIYEMITGQLFTPASYPAHERIQAALAEYA